MNSPYHIGHKALPSLPDANEKCEVNVYASIHKLKANSRPQQLEYFLYEIPTCKEKETGQVASIIITGQILNLIYSRMVRFGSLASARDVREHRHVGLATCSMGRSDKQISVSCVLFWVFDRVSIQRVLSVLARSEMLGR